MANLILLTVVVLWGVSFVGTKMALAYLTPVEVVTIRILLALPVLRIVLALKKGKIVFTGSDYKILLTASLILGVHFLIQAVGLNYTTATNTSWLIATIPVFIAGTSYVFLRERLTFRKIGGIAIAAAGVVLLVSRGQLDNLDWLQSFGDWLILGSCVTWTVYTIATRNISRRSDPLAMILVLLILPAIFFVLFTLFKTPFVSFANLPFHIIMVLIFIGVFCLGAGHWLWIEGLARKGATDAGAFIYIEPIVTTAVAIPVLGEKLTVFTVIGAALIISGVYLVERRNRR